MQLISTLINLPKPSAKRMALRVTAPAERAIRQGHPWVFDQSISEQSHAGSVGDLAVIFDSKRQFLAVGLYDPTSPIRVRVLQARQPATINTDWFEGKIKTAADIRKPLDKQNTNGYRLINGENDGLPGLILDRYADTLVLKLYTPAWIPHLNDFCTAINQVISAEHLILRLNRSMQQQINHLHGLSDGMTLSGQAPPSLILFKENGLIFECDPLNGQKTGFFLDQRENRARVEKISNKKTVLNCYAYTGGFSVYAARGGASEVISVDISQPALLAAKRNMQLNRLTVPHETIAEDVFEVLEGFKREGRLFDVVILDPPMFAQNESQIAAGLAAYRKLTKFGLSVLQKSGTLVQASCSSRIDADSFYENIHIAARETGRQLIEIEQTSHALDHPINFKEGEYLKCLFAIAN